MQNIAVEKRYINGGVRLSFFVQESDIKPGEYCLAPAEDAGAKDARIAELENDAACLRQQIEMMRNGMAARGQQIEALEKQLAAKDAESGRLVQERKEWQSQLASRSPGVMPECVRDFIDHVARRDNRNLPLGPVTAEKRRAVEAHYATPGYEWQPVDADHPITSADVGRKVTFRHGGSSAITEFINNVPWNVRVNDIGFHACGLRHKGKNSANDITHILRPVAPPFVFDGTPGRYVINSGHKITVISKPTGELCGLLDNGTWGPVNADGTFDGGRIVGRVE